MKSRNLLSILVILVLAAFTPTRAAAGEDWGAYSLVPAGAQGFVLEAVDAGTAEGTPVSINKPDGQAAPEVERRAEGGRLLRDQARRTSRRSRSRRRRAARRWARAIVLEKDERQAVAALEADEAGERQLHASRRSTRRSMGLDHFGGKQEAGAKIDLWTLQADRPAPAVVHPPARRQRRRRGEGGRRAEATSRRRSSRRTSCPARPSSSVFTQSKVFPGTVRDVTVFIPAQYDGKKPACVYVKTDGYNPREKTLLETMIATKEIPVTVGVFVRPGDLPAPMKGTLGRRNRDFEYDGVNDNNVRFLDRGAAPVHRQGVRPQPLAPTATTAASPAAAAAASRPSPPPGTGPTPSAASMRRAGAGWRSAAGTSSRRWCASSRPSRSAPSSPPRRTTWRTAAGDWFLLDQEMDKALKFSGYDYQFRIIDGPPRRRLHGTLAGGDGVPVERLAAAREGRPQRTAGAGNPHPRRGLAARRRGLQEHPRPGVQRRPARSSSPTPPNNKIHRIGLDGKVSEFVADAGAGPLRHRRRRTARCSPSRKSPAS